MDIRGSSRTATRAWRGQTIRWSSPGQRESALITTLTGDDVIDRVSSAAIRGS